MKFSLRMKLSLSYIFVALFLVAIILFLTNFIVENQFKNYILKQQEQRNKDTLNLLKQQYKDDVKEWNKPGIESLGVNALAEGIILKVKDSKGNMVWDATVHNNGLCSTMLAHMAQNMSSRYPGFKGGYVEATYPITRNFVQVGTVYIGYYGPYYFTDSDLAFINSLNRMLLAVGCFAFLFALLLGAFMSKRLSMPISKVIESAKKISRGYLSVRILQKSTTKEIGQLTATINDLAETLEKQDKLRKRLTADVAHELRTPLATLQSHLEAMIDGIWEPDTGRLKSCHEEAIRLNKMVGDLERLARYESENLVLDKTEFIVSDLVQNILKNFETDFINKKIKLSFSGDVGKITADKDKISQVIINLVSNALKYTLEGGSVEIVIKELTDKTEFRIKDTGIGISHEDLQHIFERFYRADKSRNRITGGAGIGLAIVKSIVEAHKGHITVNSDMNRGSEFIVSLPNNEK